MRPTPRSPERWATPSLPAPKELHQRRVEHRGLLDVREVCSAGNHDQLTSRDRRVQLAGECRRRRFVKLTTDDHYWHPYRRRVRSEIGITERLTRRDVAVGIRRLDHSRD